MAAGKRIYVERVVRDLGNYVGTFIRADPNNFIGVWRDYLRVRVRINIDCPLKRKKKVEKQGGVFCYANFKYEGLPTFCFICGVLGHSERFCEQLFHTPMEQIKKPFSLELKAAPRRRNYASGERWLRSGVATKHGGVAFSEHTAAGENNRVHKGSPMMQVPENSFQQNQSVTTIVGSSSNQPIMGSNDKNKMVIDLVEGSKQRAVPIDYSVVEEINVENMVGKESAIIKEKSILIIDTKRRRTEGEGNVESVIDNEVGRWAEGVLGSDVTNGPNQCVVDVMD
uniref:Zinc knuckle CX2CX4HX4C domain-containing protein n=1 Tax=Cannabis sativa TaxID=3483 RepID=A0A803PQP1_CANSA